MSGRICAELVAVTAVAGLVACGGGGKGESTTNGSGTGTSSGGGGSSGSTGTSGAIVYWSIGAGTITGSVTADVFDEQISVQHEPGDGGALLLFVAEPLSDGGDNIVVTSPVGSEGQLISAIVIPDPVVGTYTSSSSCVGAVVLSETNAANPLLNQALSATGPATSTCPNPSAPLAIGSWTLTLASVTLIVDGGGTSPPTESLYQPHGTLTATMGNGDGTSGDPSTELSTLNLTF